MICMKRAIASCLALRMSLPFGTSAKTNESFYIAFQAEVYTLGNIYFNIRHST